jgi:hypothetical protein
MSKRKLVTVAAAIFAVAAGSTAFAAIPDAGGVIHGCYDKQSGQARIYDSQTNLPKGCGAKEAAITWNQQGPQGPKGDKGDTGNPGPSDGYFSSYLSVDFDYPDTVVQTLDLPAGKYLVSATTHLQALKYSTNASCTLVAGNSGDFEQAELQPSLGIYHAGISLSVAYASASPAQAQLKCSADVGNMTANYPSISAIKVGNLTTK